MSSEILRQQLYDSYKNRAVLYYLIYDEMRQALGPQEAEAIMRRAIYRRGEQVGRKFADYGPADLERLKQAFLSGIPDEGRMFQPEIIRSDAEALDIKFHGCPLRDAWLEMGLPDDEVAALCRMAATIDNGTFESAGFRFSADTWQAGDEGCCYLHIRPGSASGSDKPQTAVS
jgi:hypothetical protein